MINIVVPLAGKGSSFKEKGELFPKNLVEINGKPMIEWVISSLKIDIKHRFIFIIRNEDFKDYSFSYTLRLLSSDSEIVVAQQETAGSVCSALLAIDFINNEQPLIIVNGDQIIQDNLFEQGINYFIRKSFDGGIITFPAVHPKWSYVRLDENNYVIEVAEKKPISKNATAGVYYFRKGLDFVNAAFRMIRKDIRTLGQFFVCPVYNELILDGRKIGVFSIEKEKMISLGTPEEVNQFKNKSVFGG
ncbi:glycosyltransferase family 2 protein [Cohnella massiliensis]|uniref:glycosyltransferase family 2 protein n=1 Tax=Cohnella massiliensis TaxID=1816691 RepID=UPI0009BBF0BD|nr:glycosyltransferase family 2 protein [Cohnella massiliensis]